MYRPTLETLNKIANKINVELVDLFEKRLSFEEICNLDQRRGELKPKITLYNIYLAHHRKSDLSVEGTELSKEQKESITTRIDQLKNELLEYNKLFSKSIDLFNDNEKIRDSFSPYLYWEVNKDKLAFILTSRLDRTDETRAVLKKIEVEEIQ